jgi:hypothetical protein
MSNVFKKAMSLIIGTSPLSLGAPKDRLLKKLTERELLQLESEIGAKLFGEIPAGRRREFFCLNAKTWMWHEEWIDPDTKKPMQMTTRYEVRPGGILKAQAGARYSYIEGQELENLALATRMYYEQVARGVYNIDPHTGQKLA